MKHLIRAVVSVALLIAFVGCGKTDKRAPVSGKVTVVGKAALTGGNIQFISASDPNRIGAGLIKADGTYEVFDAPVGECKVVIDNTHLDSSAKKSNAPGMATGPGGGMPGGGMKGMPGGGAPQSAPKEADKAKMAGGPKGAEVANEMNQGKTEHAAEKFLKIDGAYSKPETTSLKADIKNGANTLDFEVK
jgi:hypothetical protein